MKPIVEVSVKHVYRTKCAEAAMTPTEFINWASSPEGIAILGTGSVIGIGATLYKTGVAARVTSYALDNFRAGWNFETPSAFVQKTAKTASLLITVGSLVVSFDAAYAKTMSADQLTNETLIELSQQNASKRLPSRGAVYIAIANGKSQL